MELRTTFKITPSPDKITYNDPVMFIGSCFATSVGKQFEMGHLPVMINPTGTVYNPVSVCNTLETITDRRKCEIGDLYNHNGTWLSFNHYTDFSSDDPEKILRKVNNRSAEAAKFISSARFLFVTFGTARVYRWKKSGEIVSNCHKIPTDEFTNELLSVSDIVTLWNYQLDKLKLLYPSLKIVFTISPVRHWKDGAHGNQVSKAVLFLAVEELLYHSSNPAYFPAYEIIMDDLRDYRYYDNDMLHPSSTAVDYIWEVFSKCYLDDKTYELWKEVSGITKAANHIIQRNSRDQVRKFAENIISRIGYIKSKAPGIDLKDEEKYFHDLMKFTW